MADCSRKRKTSGAPKTNPYTLRDNLWNIDFDEKLNKMSESRQKRTRFPASFAFVPDSVRVLQSKVLN